MTGGNRFGECSVEVMDFFGMKVVLTFLINE